MKKKNKKAAFKIACSQGWNRDYSGTGAGRIHVSDVWLLAGGATEVFQRLCSYVSGSYLSSRSKVTAKTDS